MTDTPKGPEADTLHQLIAVRAFQIWEEHGKPQGCAALHWRQAEQDIMASVREAAASRLAQPAERRDA
jgi:N-acetylglutamate synthase-like GNAT family acetyltransferase